MIKQLLLINLVSVTSFTLSSIFREWYCIGFENNIDRSKPYKFNIGELPMVSWFDNKNNTYSSINICKHNGAELSNGKITNGNLICPNHKIQYKSDDNFGITKVYENKLWWSYEPKNILPPKIPLYNKKYDIIEMEYEIDSYITECLLTLMNVNNYDNPLGYNLILQPNNVNNYRYNNDIGILFDYNLLTNMNINLKLSENFLYYKYPSTIWFRHSINYRENNRLEYDNIFLNINLLPLNINKTKWYVTITYNNLQNSTIKKAMIKKSINKMLIKFFNQLSNQSKNVLLKEYMMTHKKQIIYDSINQDFEYLLKKYSYPDIQSVINLYNYHKMKTI